MVGWYHCLNGHEFEQIPGDSEEQGSLVCCSPWGHKESDITELLNNNNNTRCWEYKKKTLSLLLSSSSLGDKKSK